ncbi:VOC family protein [Amycolatopsis rhabdoformis]|uniref:VOC family protein n=1 Tax=Amycolatopsis rhabdoformis TaxID=1448059 RepID=A0ABZ1IK35_9PSEU|nr:VOC family protein [Amycolatopsis rhabdoformis]WSE34584.1 VOC family protein [Amycolatopsis rhabdoformis]
MSGVQSLGYLVVRGPVEEWRKFGADVLGAEVTSDGENGIRLRIDEHAYRIVVEDGPAEGPASLKAIGWELASAVDLADLVETLEKANCDIREDVARARARNVRKLYTLTDPEGTQLELYYGPESDHTPFASSRGVRFVTGSMGAGHVFIFAKDAEKSAAFYIDLLGFKLTDTILVGEQDAIFLHCNPRHHSIALLNVPAHGIGHLMLEVETIADVGRAFDDAQKNSNVTMSIGEHTNDKMLSFYLPTPSGFDIEYGVNGRVLDENLTVAHYSQPSIWGHHRSPLAGK